MKKKQHLYDAFGELIYLVAMADGIIQPEETEALDKILANHSWAKEIKWSFDYESKKNNNPETLYKKVIMACHDHGPDAEYQFLLEVMEAVANASVGIDDNEEATIKGFMSELTERFKEDIERFYANEWDH